MARLAPIRHPHIQRYLHNIVTLATPHGNPLYAFDESIHRVHQSLVVAFEDKDDDVDMLVVSISGGLRDEMIDPQACAIQRGASPSVSPPCTDCTVGVSSFLHHTTAALFLLFRYSLFIIEVSGDVSRAEWSIGNGSSSHCLVPWCPRTSAQSDLGVIERRGR